MTSPSPADIRAAGGLVVRDGLVCICHRPRYDDWSLPKGKLDPGETFKQAALREVEEEVRLRCRIEGKRLAKVTYPVNQGVKEVRWWQMSVVEDLGFEPNDEVDQVVWLSPGDARRLLTYDKDRQLLGLARV
ncbi:MAG: NUDIX hydrolase [Baekduia sp.]